MGTHKSYTDQIAPLPFMTRAGITATTAAISVCSTFSQFMITNLVQTAVATRGAIY